MPSIDLSEKTYKRLLAQIQSFDDTAESVIERLLQEIEKKRSTRKIDKLKTQNTSSSGKEGDLLPEGDYWTPILELLTEAGGEARGSQVIDALEDRIGPQLTELDRDKLEMGEVRWRNRARFARLRMKELGLLSSESRRGIWEITQKGRDFLAAEQDFS